MCVLGVVLCLNRSSSLPIRTRLVALALAALVLVVPLFIALHCSCVCVESTVLNRIEFIGCTLQGTKVNEIKEIPSH